MIVVAKTRQAAVGTSDGGSRRSSHKVADVEYLGEPCLDRVGITRTALEDDLVQRAELDGREPI